MPHYCDIAPNNPVHAYYHAHEYGFPATDERVLFERLALEIMQAGLSWEIVLKKRAAINAAFDGFDADKVADYVDGDMRRLLADSGIIRNRLKIAAVIHNARQIIGLRESHGGFGGWLAAHNPRDKAEWVKLFRGQFKFMGGEIVGEFLMGIGYLSGAHHADCPVAKRLAIIKP